VATATDVAIVIEEKDVERGCMHCRSTAALKSADMISQHGAKWGELKDSEKKWCCSSCDRLISAMSMLSMQYCDDEDEDVAAGLQEMRDVVMHDERFAKVVKTPGWLESLEAARKARDELHKFVRES
jgi:hypothetical protein